MLKLRLKGPNGNTLIFIGLGPKEIEALAEAPLPVDGESLGLGEDVKLAIMAGSSPQAMLQEIEANMPVRFPRDEKTGAYLQVNT